MAQKITIAIFFHCSYENENEYVSGYHTKEQTTTVYFCVRLVMLIKAVYRTIFVKPNCKRNHLRDIGSFGTKQTSSDSYNQV